MLNKSFFGFNNYKIHLFYSFIGFSLLIFHSRVLVWIVKDMKVDVGSEVFTSLKRLEI